MHPINSGVVLWREGTGDDLLVLLHGVGSNEADLFGLVDYLPAQFTVASLRAPLQYGFGGWAWFEFNPLVDSDDHTQIDASTAGVLAWLDGLERDYARTHLLGFSQGGAVAVQLARFAPERFASLTHLSSFVHKGDLPGCRPSGTRTTSSPPTSATVRCPGWTGTSTCNATGTTAGTPSSWRNSNRSSPG